MKPSTHQNHSRWLGQILLAQPVAGSWLAAFGIVLVLGIAAALVLVDYTRKERVTGLLTLDKGLLKVYSPAAHATVLEKRVREGDEVMAGQILFVLSTERTTAKGLAHADVLQRIQERKGSLLNEKTKLHQMLANDEDAMRLRVTLVQQEIEHLSRESEAHKIRLRLVESNWMRHQALLGQQFVSLAATESAEQDFLDHQMRWQAMQRGVAGLNKELAQLQNELTNAPQKRHNRMADLDREVARLEQDISETESRREIRVLAPQAGRITSISAEMGHTVNAEKPLAAVLPQNALLRATLYLPSRAFGFVEVGQTVTLRYPAYPYQKFGQYKGQLIEVSRTAMSAEELKAQGLSIAEPYYRVRAELASQTVQAYGKQVALQESTQVEADILIDTRKLYEWVLEPLYSVTGKL